MSANTAPTIGDSPLDSRAPGGRSSVGRAPGCGPGGRGFESRRSPLSEPPAKRVCSQRAEQPKSAHGDRFGDRCASNYPGTTENEVGGDEPPIRFRGDEADLYLAHNDQLVRDITRAVTAHPADIEDACAFAWVQFFRYQPDRERNWQGWLFRTAQREAWRLNARHRTERPMLNDTVSFGVDPDSVPADPRDRYEERLDFLAALEELASCRCACGRRPLPLPGRGRRDVAEVLGISRQRVAFLLHHVTAAMRDITERRIEAERPVASPRAARLRELEDNPPPWLVSEIGRNGGRGKNDAGTKLAWRRAALSIDDYRGISGWASPSEAIGPTPMDPAARAARDRAERAIGQLRRSATVATGTAANADERIRLRCRGCAPAFHDAGPSP